MAILTTDVIRHWSTEFKMTSHGPTIDRTLISQFAPLSCSHYKVTALCDHGLPGGTKKPILMFSVIQGYMCVCGGGSGGLGC